MNKRKYKQKSFISKPNLDSRKIKDSTLFFKDFKVFQVRQCECKNVMSPTSAKFILIHHRLALFNSWKAAGCQGDCTPSQGTGLLKQCNSLALSPTP